jgi:phospholipase/lecithinase/hemolysin
MKSVIPLWKEVEYFKEYKRRLRRHAGRAAARRIVSDALYVVSIGTNDFLENYFLLVTGRFAEFTAAEFEDFLVAEAERFLAEIHRLGARRVTFAGLSPIGCLPLERTLNSLRGGCIEEYNQVARDYNDKLLAMLRRLTASRPSLKVAYINVYQNMLDLITNPSTLGESSIEPATNFEGRNFMSICRRNLPDHRLIGTAGLENVEEGCCATGKVEMSYLCNDKNPLTCEDAGKYFFWDSFHPTEKVNKFFAKKTLDLCYEQLF